MTFSALFKKTNVLHFTILLFVQYQVTGQTGNESQNAAFSDFHIHTSFKNYYRYVESPDSLITHKDNRLFLNQKYGQYGWLPYAKKLKDKKKGKESNMGNYDEANYANLTGLDSSILCLSITPPEKILFSTKSERWLKKPGNAHVNSPPSSISTTEKFCF